MCGIVAYYSSRAQRATEPVSVPLYRSLSEAAKTLHHRGPDDINVYVSNTVHAGRYIDSYTWGI